MEKEKWEFKRPTFKRIIPRLGFNENKFKKVINLSVSWFGLFCKPIFISASLLLITGSGGGLRILQSWWQNNTAYNGVAKDTPVFVGAAPKSSSGEPRMLRLSPEQLLEAIPSAKALPKPIVRSLRETTFPISTSEKNAPKNNPLKSNHPIAKTGLSRVVHAAAHRAAHANVQPRGKHRATIPVVVATNTAHLNNAPILQSRRAKNSAALNQRSVDQQALGQQSNWQIVQSPTRLLKEPDLSGGCLYPLANREIETLLPCTHQEDSYYNIAYNELSAKPRATGTANKIVPEPKIDIKISAISSSQLAEEIRTARAYQAIQNASIQEETNTRNDVSINYNLPKTAVKTLSNYASITPAITPVGLPGLKRINDSKKTTACYDRTNTLQPGIPPQPTCFSSSPVRINDLPAKNIALVSTYTPS